jgi:prepilin-type N-terminal cleavage/methylation domain-containing protein
VLSSALRRSLLERSRRLTARGFTLTELLIVIALISLLAVVGSPTFIKMVRERRAARAGSIVIDYMRTARTMAIGRGQPILFGWRGGGNTGFFEIWEPIVTNSSSVCACSTTQWRSTSAATCQNRQLTSFTLQNGMYENAYLTFYDESGATQTGVDICFSPTGRMYMRTGSSTTVTGAFLPVMGVPTFVAQYKEGTNPVVGVGRTVYLMPNGTARMQL